MAKTTSSKNRCAITAGQMATALKHIGAEITNGPLRSSVLARIMREKFGGSDAVGAWDWRMAYDMMQAAAVRKGETVLEPSAGTGALAAFASRADAKLLLNEIDAFRQHLLRAVFKTEISAHDGEHIDDLLQVPVQPDVILMNPPFASSVDRSKDKHIAAKHLISAAKRLASGGRLVAIMPPGFTPERDAAHWTRACGILTPRLALTMPGQVYRKLGTSVETQLMVFDKVQEGGEMIRVSVRDLEEAVGYVDEVAVSRPQFL